MSRETQRTPARTGLDFGHAVTLPPVSDTLHYLALMPAELFEQLQFEQQIYEVFFR